MGLLYLKQDAYSGPLRVQSERAAQQIHTWAPCRVQSTRGDLEVRCPRSVPRTPGKQDMACVNVVSISAVRCQPEIAAPLLGRLWVARRCRRWPASSRLLGVQTPGVPSPSSVRREGRGAVPPSFHEYGGPSLGSSTLAPPLICPNTIVTFLVPHLTTSTLGLCYFQIQTETEIFFFLTQTTRGRISPHKYSSCPACPQPRRGLQEPLPTGRCLVTTRSSPIHSCNQAP